ncbi:GPALPP motifs-containing protein 1 [Pseudophryne corroboree]|uniref:GPALPP motifs-containing protein 1 n=1 Tax=Pseudophryne corroboree TaxID=495146 RepID=UPI003081393D
MSRDVIGPALPPGFRSVNDREEAEDEVAGPVLPPGYHSNHSSDSSEDSDQEITTSHSHHKESDDTTLRKLDMAEDDDFFGPALPPGFKKQSDSPGRPVIGPALPPGFRGQNSDSEDGSNNGESSDMKYKLEDMKDEDDEEEDDIIGPVPAKGPVQSSVADDFERRALKMKQKLTAKDDDGPKNLARESWMTELPPEMTNIGLGARTFKRRTIEKSGDRSDWTDTPADKERKAIEKQEAKVSSSKGEEKVHVSERDKRLTDQVSTYNDSKRTESLMDLHRKKLKRKAEEDKNKPKERRAFDREQDLQVNRFDDAQKKALLRKSKELNTKFSHGNSSMFL